ncbi:MAG: response regulator [Hyphomicrobiales bacterium]
MGYRAAAGAAVSAAGPLSLRQPDGSRPQLLLAEDSIAMRVVTSALLKAMGCDVDAVEHGEQALNCARAKKFDLIVLDIEMPVMDGIAAARSIRNLGGAPGRTPLMALSAFLADTSQSVSWRETFDVALPKPANRNELHAAVEAALTRKPAAPRPVPFETHPPLSPSGIAGLKSGLPAGVWAELVAVACRDIADCVRHIARIVRHGEAGSLAFYGHQLRGLAVTFAAPQLAAVAGRLDAISDAEEADAVAVAIGRAASAAIAALEASI